MKRSAAFRRRVPAPLRRPGRKLLGLLDRPALWLRRHRGEAIGEVPPRELRARVGAPDPVEYETGGAHAASELRELLAGHARPFDSFASILDLGSGPGRVLSGLGAADGARLHACDIDAEAVAWLGASRPEIDARANAFRPPTPFADASFDLVFALSVFTHVGPDDQDAWLAEVGRILAPGGVAVLTTHGPRLLEVYANGDRPGVSPEQSGRLAAADLEREGVVFAPAARTRWNRWRFPGVAGAPYGLSFHSRAYLRGHWSRYLAVEEVVPEAINWGQDAIICGPLE